MHDLRGKKSGRLTAISPTEKRRGNKIIWDCACTCGRHRLVPSGKFARGLITGCLVCDPLGRPKTRLGLSGTSEYAAWKSVSKVWPDFQEFLRTFGLRPEGHKIGRLDRTKPHGPGNTAWVPEYRHVGQSIGHLRVLSAFRRDNKLYYRCFCDCGRTVDRRAAAGLGPGSHCGDISHFITHGHCRGPKNSPTFVSWTKMFTRCYNAKSERFKNYGAKGVTVCERWHKFENFLADMGERPERKTLGRFLDRGNYEPGNCNCAWMTRAEQGLQMRNNNALRKLESSLRKRPVSVGREGEAVA